MKRLIFCVRDIKADTYGTPFLAPTVGAGLRSFADAVNEHDPNNLVAKHPGDFELYQLGVFDDSTGLYETGVPHQLAVGSDYVRPDNVTAISDKAARWNTPG